MKRDRNRLVLLCQDKLVKNRMLADDRKIKDVLWKQYGWPE